MNMSNAAWDKVNSFLLSAGSCKSLDCLYSGILESMPLLVHFDNSGVCISMDKTSSPSIISSVNSENKWNSLFNSHYHSVSLFPEFDRSIFYADNRQIKGSHKSEYYNDFLLKQKIRYTAGFMIFSPDGSSVHAFVINRTNSDGMFTEEELAGLQVAAKHLANYSAMLSQSESLNRIPVMLSELDTGNRLLSPRENEITALLVKKMKPAEISDHLEISVLTVRKHIQNIYEKLNVEDRQQLFQRIHNDYKSGR